jgi:twinkle protein
VRPPDVTLTEYVGLAIRRIRRFAKTFAVHVIVVAHPAKMQRGKDGKTPRPSLYDISDSAHWANKPDLAIVVHREDFTNNVTEIAVVKSRNVRRIGRPGTVKAIWDDERTRYTIADEAKLV